MSCRFESYLNYNFLFLILSKGYMDFQQLLEWEWFDNSQMVHIWIYFLLKANDNDYQWHGIDIHRGSFVTSYDSICKATGLSMQNVRTCINRLKSTNEITVKSTNKFTIITICKYDSYTDYKTQSNKQNNKQTNKQLTTDNNNNILFFNNIDNNEDKKENNKGIDLEIEFDNFRKKYKKYGGQARGLQTELDNLKKKHGDWKTIIPLLNSAIDKENAARQNAAIRGVFFPNMKNLQTYINNRSWEAYADESTNVEDNVYRPITDGIYQYWNEKRQCLMFNGYIDQLNDGYTKDNRPDGAKVAWQMYEWIWSSRIKEWIKQND